MSTRVVIATICLAAVAVALWYLPSHGIGREERSNSAGGALGHDIADALEPEPTRDYSQFPTITPPAIIGPSATTDPARGQYVGFSAGEVAEALRSEVSEDGPPATVMYSVDIGPQDAEPLGLDPGIITQDGNPDVGLILNGEFVEIIVGPGPAQPDVIRSFVLVLVDRINGAYSQLSSDDYDLLRSMLP